MENTDARVLLQHIYNTYGYQISKNFKDNAIRGAFELADKALEKQIPKKPIFDYNLSDTLSKFHCECGNTIKVNHDVGIMDDNDAPNYCSNCGQKLDWSEESEENNEID